MKRIYTSIERADGISGGAWLILIQALLSPLAFLFAWLFGLPGIRFHLGSYRIGLSLLKQKRLSWRDQFKGLYVFLFEPMDSIRYFELEKAWQLVATKEGELDYLDVGSPRLFPLEYVYQSKERSAILVNPDRSDIQRTKQCVQVLRLENRVKCIPSRIEDLDTKGKLFDLVTSISVIEHLEEESHALKKMWSFVKPNGEMVISVPCAAEAFEEWVDFDEYGLYPADQDGYVFGQRFYDGLSLQERIIQLVGEPVHMEVIGEVQKGFFFQDRDRKNRLGHRYPFWSEPIRTLHSWKSFSDIGSLPGVGVILMKFQKGEQ
jgi:SAM-dependent methyltransferase